MKAPGEALPVPFVGNVSSVDLSGLKSLLLFGVVSRTISWHEMKESKH